MLKRRDEDLKEWMFISVDTSGRVMICTVKKGFMMNVSKMVLVEPQRGFKPYSLACRFVNPDYPQAYQSDFETLVAIGSQDLVCILRVTKDSFE